MRRVPVEQLSTGDRLGRDIYGSSDGLPLLRAGVSVSESYRPALQRAGIMSVWIDDGISEGIEPMEVLEEATRRRAVAAIRDGFRDIAHSLSAGRTLSADVVQDMNEVAELIVRDVTKNIHSALALYDLANTDGYTLKHSLAVTTIGVALGLRVMRKHGWIDAHGKRRFDGLHSRLVALGVGLLLHDIGKLAVPPDILRKAGPLTDEERQAVHAHPTLGYQMLKNFDAISPLSRVVVRSHHERWNGTGYPDGQSGADIHQFAHIGAVADVFDAVASDRCYRRAVPMRDAYDLIVGRSHRDFDPDVVSAFQSFVAPYPPGTPVVLSDGTGGLVKEVRPERVKSPVVRIVNDRFGASVTPWEIDLSKSPGLTIVSTEFELPATEHV